MTTRALRNIHTTGTSCSTHFHAQHGTKTTPVFLSANGEASWSLIASSVSLLSYSTVQPENTYSCILKMTGQVNLRIQAVSTLRIQDAKLITPTTSAHLPKSVSTDLTIQTQF